MALRFAYSQQDFVADVRRSNSTTTRLTDFDTVVQAGWTDRMDRGLFRYHLGDLQTRILPGTMRYVAQLNISRGTERRKPQEILSVQQGFNPKQFNFNKINRDEVIGEMVKVTDGGPSTMVVLINVSPLEFGHCLFVPDPSMCFPQVLTKFAIQSGMESVFLSSHPGFRVGFNSLGALASVNHLHLHGYYLNQQLSIESTAAEPLVPERSFHLLLDFPGGYLFYATSEKVEEVARAVCRCTDFLVESNIAHNVFMTRGCPPWDGGQDGDRHCRRGVRVVVFPRLSCFGCKEESAFNVALCELAGHLPFKNERDFEQSTEEDVKDIIQKCLLPEAEAGSLELQLTERLTSP